MFQQLIQLLSDIFYPHTCPGCGRPVAGRALLCDTCRQGILNPRRLQQDPIQWPHLSGLFFLFNYEGGIREALRFVKFSHREDLLPGLAWEWEQGLREQDLFQWKLPEDIRVSFVPIPTDASRARLRGYEIPEEIFRHWCLAQGYTWDPLLLRIKATKPQFSLSPKERKENIRDCFALSRQTKLPDIVVLMDDIATTGATLEEAGKILRKAGIKYVYAAALASGRDM